MSDTEIGGESTLFHAINRGKESFAADLKNPKELAQVMVLIASADVMIQSFRPGVIDRIGLDYAAVRAINPRIIYGSITGYGGEGPWAALPGQDLLAQARSGLMWLNGDPDQGPVPLGLAVGDMMAGNILAQGLLAGLVRRGVTGQGVHVETSLLEALLDLQFEVLTTHLNDGGRLPARSGFRNAHAYLAAPYGVYPTADGWLALAMTPMRRLAELMDRPEFAAFDGKAAFERRDEAKRMIAEQLATRTTAQWLAIFEPADLWCAEVLDWPALLVGRGGRGARHAADGHQPGRAGDPDDAPAAADRRRAAGHQHGRARDRSGHGRNPAGPNRSELSRTRVARVRTRQRLPSTIGDTGGVVPARRGSRVIITAVALPLRLGASAPSDPGTSRFPCGWCPGVHGVSDRAGPASTSP